MLRPKPRRPLPLFFFSFYLTLKGKPLLTFLNRSQLGFFLKGRRVHILLRQEKNAVERPHTIWQRLFKSLLREFGGGHLISTAMHRACLFVWTKNRQEI